MKILFLTRNRENLVCVEIWNNLEHALGKLTDSKWAGKGWPLYKPNETITQTVERVMPDADWVVLEKSAKIPKTRSFKVTAHIADIHGYHKLNLNAKQYAHYLNKKNWDSLAMMYQHVDGVQVPPDYFLKTLKCPIFHLAPCINPETFKPSDTPKQIDASLLGSIHPRVYPLRTDIWYRLPPLATRKRWNIFLRDRPPGAPTERRDIDRMINQGYIVGHKYVETLQTSKVFIFGTSIFQYPLMKFVEGMSTGALVMANQPSSMDALHYVPDWNFVDITRRNWRTRLEHFLSHDEEREEITSNALDTILKYHTMDIRARAWAKHLEEHS